MKPRILLLMLSVVLAATCLAAQQNVTPDSKQEGLAIWARLKLMTQSEFQELLARAQSGDAASQYQVGLAYDMGKHVPRDSNEAARWFLKSAEQGYPPAEGAYGQWIRQSNNAVAERWMLRAAEHGDVSTQFWLGVAYDDNWFGTTDSELALKWYQKAADAGNPDAQVILGQKYADGEGVKQSYEIAAKWFRRAAEHVPDLGGAGQGRYRLGQLYMDGLGVPRNYLQAYFWFSLWGPDAATDAKEHLSAAQIQEADKLVKDWQQQHRVSPEVEAAPMEAFASHQGVRTTWFNEVARWEQDGIRLILTAVVLEDSARKSRGVKVDLSSENARDQVYLDEQATERTRLALVEISDAVALTGMPGIGGCIGAKEFWAGYDWPWNKYHELNVNFCGDSKNRVLVLHGRGKPGSFQFPGKSPTVLAEILATAMQKLKEH